MQRHQVILQTSTMAAPSTLFSDLTQQPNHWEEPTPSYVVLTGAVGGGSASNRADTAEAILNTSQRSPILIAFVVGGDEDYIHVGHSMSKYPASLGANTPFDNHHVVLVGNDLTSAVPVVLPIEAFERTPDTRFPTLEHIAGVNMHAANPPVLRSGPHGPAAANVNEYRVRRAMVLPTVMTQRALTQVPDGRYSLTQFYTLLLEPEVNHTEVVRRGAVVPLRDWYRACCTNNAGGSIVRVDPVTSPAPVMAARLNRWTHRVTKSHLDALGSSGPAVTTAAFNAGIQALRQTMDANTRESLQYDRDKSNKTFTDRHGEALAQRLQNLCLVDDDDSLPEVHRLIAKSPKAKDYGIVQSMIDQRIMGLGNRLISSTNAPIATPTLTDEVFRSFRISDTGQTLGQGLTPFAIVCKGHPEQMAVQRLVQQATLVETGSTVTLRDASSLTSSSVKMPTTPQMAVEKLLGWSVVVDIFHGVDHPVAKNIRAFVDAVHPLIHHVHGQRADTPVVAMELVCRVLYDAQQDYFGWANLAGNNRRAAVPDFQETLRYLSSFRVSRLSELPTTWLVHFKTGDRGNTGAPPGGAGTPRAQAGAVSTVNAHADARLVRRFKDSGHATISAMVGGRELEIPKHAGKDVCLVWALKGQCQANCKRKEAHVRYGRDTIGKLHELLTTCEVADAQP